MWRTFNVAWNSLCKLFVDDDLGLRSVTTINRVAMLKLGWELISSNLHWTKLPRGRVLKKNEVISGHISSSIWIDIKSEFVF